MPEAAAVLQKSPIDFLLCPNEVNLKHKMAIYASAN
jgi:hypothetical protein